MNILLTGPPHVGKSTILGNLIADVENKQGFVTNEVKENDQRIGFELVSAIGDRALLASVNSDSKIRVSRYGVDVSALDMFIKRQPNIKPEELLYIDEIGQMELYSEIFRNLVLQYLEAPNPFIGTITSVYDDEFTQVLRTRKDIEIVRLTESNRDQVRTEITQRISTLYS